jgi:hypothetical protein
MGLAFRELLNKGLEGAQAYVQDMKQADPEIGNKAQQQLQSIAPLFADPKLEGGTAQRALEAFYQSVDNQWKLKNEPDYFQKLGARKQADIEIQKAAEEERRKTLKVKRKEDVSFAERKFQKQVKQVKSLEGVIKKRKEPDIKEFFPTQVKRLQQKLETEKETLQSVQNEFDTARQKKRLFGKKKLQEKLDEQAALVRDLTNQIENFAPPSVMLDPKGHAAFQKAQEKIRAQNEKDLATINKIRTEGDLPAITLDDITAGVSASEDLVAPVTEESTATEQPKRSSLVAPDILNLIKQLETAIQKIEAGEGNEEDNANLPAFKAELERLRSGGA